MADEASIDATSSDDASTDTSTADASTSTKTTETTVQDERKFTQKDLDGLIHKRLEQERGKYADYDDLKAKADETDSLKTKLSARELENVKLRVASAKNVPLDVIEHLKGETEEELSSAVDALMKVTKPSGGFDAGVRTPVVTKDISSETDPAKIREWAKSLGK